MSTSNKQRLVALLGARNIPLIEDDVYDDVHFDDERPSIAKCFDRDGLVLTCSSFFKTLAPGYRLSSGYPWNERTEEALVKVGRLVDGRDAGREQQPGADIEL